ncbi:MAG: hypothetical protein UV79_C0012G0010 [candidate division TM6 bacterium GW2011_GWF2_43_17]|nr:MAG: hypothetical protein UV79_C0012G0010 [candidate division TM6 bacterium GW2011_GWF2_43_17]
MLFLNTAVSIFASHEQEKPPRKKRRFNISCHQGFSNMFFWEKNGTQNFLSAIKETHNANEKKDALFSFFDYKNLEDLSLAKLENIIFCIKTLPSQELRELFYSLEEETGERFLYKFATQYTVTSEYQEKEIIQKAILETALKACCPEPNETGLMTQQRLYLIKSLLKGFTTVPQCVLEKSAHKQYFELISQLEPEEQAKLLPQIMDHVGKYIKDLPATDDQTESQHYSLEVIYHCLTELSLNNSNLIEDWVSQKWLKKFLTRVKNFYSKDTCTHLVEILGPDFPASPAAFAQ